VHDLIHHRRRGNDPSLLLYVILFFIDNLFVIGVYTYYMTETLKQGGLTLAAPPCACANLRRAARAVTRLYNRELLSEGIEITQFTLMIAAVRWRSLPGTTR
jgi:hypothetical protein